MNSVEDEQSSFGLNGRLRPRKSNGPSPQPIKASRRTEGKIAQDRSKKSFAPSKTSPSKPDDLANKSDFSLILQLLCPYCDRKFSSKQSLSKHNRRIHFASAKQDGFIKCMHCNLSEADPNEIIRHMVDSHPNQYFACLDCHTRFPSTTELAEHKLNVCEKQKQPYRNKLRRKISSRKNRRTSDKIAIQRIDREYQDGHNFNGIVISCELKPSHENDEADIEDNITTNLILPPNKSLVKNTTLDKNAVIVLDDIQWNKRMPPNFSFHNTDADQILSRLGVVHRSPRTGESTRRDWFKSIDDSTQKFEKCFDTSFYSKVASNVQENLSKYLDGSFNSNPDPDNVIKTRKAKNSVVINTAEGFPILLASNQYSRNVFEGYNMPRAIAPKHKWKWENLDVDKSTLNPDQIKRDSHANNCIISLVSSLDIWTQLCMRNKFEDKFCRVPIEKKTEKKNIISKELKEILESREIPTSSSTIVKPVHKPVVSARKDFPAMLGLVPVTPIYEEPPAVLSGEWVRPRCYVCCACGEQMYDARALSSHKTNHHPNAQVQHYEIAGEVNADIVKHLYVPPSQTINRTRPPRGIRECTKCKTTISLEDLHQHMLDCAGDTPAVRRKCRNRPFGVRKRRTRIPDKTMRKKIRKHLRNRRARQKNHVRPRPRIRSEVGDAETIRKMLADLPAKRHRVMVNPLNFSIASKKLESQRTKLLLKRHPTEMRNRKKSCESTANKTEDNTVNNDDQKKKLSKNSDEESKPLKTRITRVVNKKIQRDGLKRKLSRPMRNTTRLRRQLAKQIISDKEPLNDNGDDPSNVKSDQLSLNNAPQKIDLLAQPYNTRQNSDHNGANNREGHDQPVDDNQNRNAQNDPAPPNVPLKHSIARLTANSETHDKSVQFHQNFLVQQECNNIDDHSTSEQQLLFENEVAANELDKPPLQCEPVDFRVELNLSDQNRDNEKLASDSQAVPKNKLNKPRKGLNDCIAMLKNKLVEPIPKSSGHVSVQCGSDEPLYPLPSVLQKPKAATEVASFGIKVPINQTEMKNANTMKISTTIDVKDTIDTTDTLLELPKRILSKITEKGTDIKKRSKSGSKNVTIVQPIPEQKYLLSNIDGKQKYNMNKFIAVEQDSVPVIQETAYSRKVSDPVALEAPTLIQESVLLPLTKSFSKLQKHGFIQEPELILQQSKSDVNRTSDNILPNLKKSCSRLDLIKRSHILSKHRDNVTYPCNNNDIGNLSSHNKLGSGFMTLRETSDINTLNKGEKKVHTEEDNLLSHKEIETGIQSDLTKLKSNLISKTTLSAQLSSNIQTDQNSNRKHSENVLVDLQNSNASKILLAHTETLSKDVHIPLDLSGKIITTNKLQIETSSISTHNPDCLDLTNKRLDESLVCEEVVDLRVKINEKQVIPITKAHVPQTCLSVINDEITDLSTTTCLQSTPTDLSVRAKETVKLTNFDRNFNKNIDTCKKLPSCIQVNISKKLDEKNIISVHDHIPHVLSPFSSARQVNYNLSNDLTSQIINLENIEVPTDLSRKEKDRGISITAGCSTQNKILLDISSKSLSQDVMNSKIVNSYKCKDQKPLYHTTLNTLQHQKVIATTAISTEQRRTTVDVCSKINSPELTGELDYLVSNAISNIIPTQENSICALSNTISRENTVTFTTFNVTSAKNLTTQSSTVCFEKVDKTKPVCTLSHATGSTILTNTSQGIPSTLSDLSIVAPINYGTMTSPSCDNMPNNSPHTTVTSLEPLRTASSVYKIKEKDRIIDENVTCDSEQDPETAKKIAMLPKELVDILGTMPIDHRNQLLNVLPQYVSTTPPAMTNNVNLGKSYDLSQRQNLATAMANSICNNTKKSEVLPTQEINTNVIQNSQNITFDRAKSIYVTNSKESSSTSKLNIYSDSEANTEKSIDLNEIIDLTTEEINSSEDFVKENKVIHCVEPTSQAYAVISLTATQKESKTINERTASLRAVRIRTPSERHKSNPTKKLLIDHLNQEVLDKSDDQNKVHKTLKNSINIPRQENTGEAIVATNISVNIKMPDIENESNTEITNNIKEIDTKQKNILKNESELVHFKTNINESDLSPILIQANPHSCKQDELQCDNNENINDTNSSSCILFPATLCPDIKDGPDVTKNLGKDDHLDHSTANAQELLIGSSVPENIVDKRQLSIDELRLQETNNFLEDDSDDNLSLALIVKQKQNKQHSDQIKGENATAKTVSSPKTRRRIEKKVTKKQNIKRVKTNKPNLIVDTDLTQKILGVSFNLDNSINTDKFQTSVMPNLTNKISGSKIQPCVSLRKSKRNKRESTQQHGDEKTLKLYDNKHKNNILTPKENFDSSETIQTDKDAVKFGNDYDLSGIQTLHSNTSKTVDEVKQNNSKSTNREICIPPRPVNCDKNKQRKVTDITQEVIELDKGEQQTTYIIHRVEDYIKGNTEQLTGKIDNTPIVESTKNDKCYFDSKKNEVNVENKLSTGKKKHKTEIISKNILEKLYLNENTHVYRKPSLTKTQIESKELEKILENVNDKESLNTKNTFACVQKRQSPKLTENPEVASTPFDLGIEINCRNVLRRSSRVKSVLVDSAPVQTDRPETSTDHKIPLTKKQLIFSKLLLDEDKFGQTSQLATEVKNGSTVPPDNLDGSLLPHKSKTTENELDKLQYPAIEENIVTIKEKNNIDTKYSSKKPISDVKESVSTEIHVQKVKSKKSKKYPHSIPEIKDLLLLEEIIQEKCLPKRSTSCEKKNTFAESDKEKIKSTKSKKLPCSVTETKEITASKEINTVELSYPENIISIENEIDPPQKTDSVEDKTEKNKTLISVAGKETTEEFLSSEKKPLRNEKLLKAKSKNHKKSSNFYTESKTLTRANEYLDKIDDGKCLLNRSLSHESNTNSTYLEEEKIKSTNRKKSLQYSFVESKINSSVEEIRKTSLKVSNRSSTPEKLTEIEIKDKSSLDEAATEKVDIKIVEHSLDTSKISVPCEKEPDSIKSEVSYSTKRKNNTQNQRKTKKKKSENVLDDVNVEALQKNCDKYSSKVKESSVCIEEKVQTVVKESKSKEKNNPTETDSPYLVNFSKNEFLDIDKNCSTSKTESSQRKYCETPSFTEKRKIDDFNPVPELPISKISRKLSKDDREVATIGIHHENIKERTEDKIGTCSKNLVSETRTACYNMPVATKRTRSKSTGFRLSEGDIYDPYDIDLDETLDTIESYKKKKITSERKCNKYKSKPLDSTKEIKKIVKTVTDDVNSNTVQIGNVEVTQVPISIETAVGGSYKGIVSDSDDSSKSDVPLTKYVKDIEKSISVSEVHRKNDNDTQNVFRSEKVVQTVTTERSCQTLTVCDTVKSVNTQDEIEEQLRSEQFMESFGFFSERKPRKSNLLATKKISETFHIIANEDELCFDSNEKAQKKTLQTGSKKEVIENTDKLTLPHFKCTAKRGRKKKRAKNAYCHICKKDFRRSDNYLRHQLTLYHISKLSEVELKVKTVRVREEPNYLITYKQHLDRLRVLTFKYNKRKKNSKAPKIKLPTLDDVVAEVNEIIMQQKLALRNLSTDEALFLDCCKLLKESHKKDPTTSDMTGLVKDVNDLVGTSHSSTTEVVFIEKTISDNEKCDTRSDGDVDSLTAKTILESEEVRNLENDLISGLKEAANASSLSKFHAEYQYESCNTMVENIEKTPEDYSGSNINESHYEPVENFEDVKQNRKSKKNTDAKNRTVGDISETIDLFEDKFDKIKRKSRSQAAAAKQTQTIVEQLKSRKGKRKLEKKGKKGKKNLHSTVLTKGALKGFDSIKVSIPTTNNIVDITTEITTKKRKKSGSKNNNHNHNKDSAMSQKKEDVYEFKDNEDVELFELRPSTLMERFKSINNKALPPPSTSKADSVDEIQNPSTSDSDGDFVYMSDKYTDEETNVSLTSLDSASKAGVDTKKTQKRKDAIEKNAVMGKIFKNNAVRTEKKKSKCKDSLVSKANLDLLFDSLLKDEPNSSILSEDTSKKNLTSPALNPETSKKHDHSDDDLVSFKKHDTSTPNKERKISTESPSLNCNSASLDFGSNSPCDRLLSKKYDISSPSGSGNNIELYSPCTSKHYFDKDASSFASMKKEISKGDKRDSDIYDNESLNDDDISVDKYGVKSKSKDKSTLEKVNKSEHNFIDIDTNEDICQPSQFDETGVARQRTRRKCAVGKQNVLAETWSSESEPEMAPPRPKSALAVMVTTRKKRGRKKEGPSASGRRAKNVESRVSSSNQNACVCVSSRKEVIAESKAGSGSSEGAVVKEVLSSPAPVSSKPRSRPSTSYWSSDGDDEQEHLQQHGWIVGDSHKKLVTMLAHAKGRKRNHDDKRHFIE